MVDFTDLVSEATTQDLLFRALEGRGAFRRFKDTLFDFPELRREWFSFHDRRMKRRAVEWLADRELIAEDAEETLAGLDDEPESIGPPGAVRVAELAAAGLRDLYGDRLVRVVLFGSQAQGEAGLSRISICWWCWLEWIHPGRSSNGWMISCGASHRDTKSRCRRFRSPRHSLTSPANRCSWKRVRTVSRSGERSRRGHGLDAGTKSPPPRSWQERASQRKL